jgi:hypothetical protein
LIRPRERPICSSADSLLFTYDYFIPILKLSRIGIGYSMEFYNIEPSLENYWRAIILFGRNVA